MGLETIIIAMIATLALCVVLLMTRKVCIIEKGYLGVIDKGGRAQKFLQPGKYMLSSRLSKSVYKIPTTRQVISDKHCKDGTHVTMDGKDIGFAYIVECKVVDPKLFYKKRIVGLEFQNTRKAIYNLLRNKIRNSTQEELVQQAVLRGNGSIDIDVKELLKTTNPAEWGVQIFKITFMPHVHGTDYEYWENFCAYAKKIPQFHENFGLPSADYDEILNLWTHDRRYTVNLWRDKSNNRVCVEFLVANKNGYFETFISRETEVEEKLNWDIEWTEQPDKTFSIVRVIKKTDEKVMDKRLWKDQFEWMIEKSIEMKEFVVDVIALCGNTNDDAFDLNYQPTKRDLVQRVCKHCGAPLSSSTRICEYCGMTHVEVIT